MQSYGGPTDLSDLTLPSAALTWLGDRSRTELIHHHAITFNPRWWGTELETRNLPGGPVLGGSDNADGRISRGRLFALAPDAASGDPEAILRLLWHVLAWGTGTGARNNQRRLDVIAADPDRTVKALHRAGQRADTDPEAAYSELRHGRRNAVAWLGPAFFTKYLYFVGGGVASHPSLILDARVARTLKVCGWHTLHSGGSWPAFTYRRYCDLLRRWAGEAHEGSRDTAPDELELWLFRSNGEPATCAWNS